MDKLENSIELYQGDFLNDLLLSELTSFQEWVILQRERHFRNYLEVLKTLSKAYYYQSNLEKSYKFAYQYVEMAPLEEDAHRLLMRLLSLTGRRTAALQQYQMCKAIIKRELGIEPSLETQQLNERIQTNSPIDRIETGFLAPKLQSDSEVDQIEATASHLYEPLTNIPLRIIFMDRLRHAITRTRRNQTNIAIVILSTTFPTQPLLKPDQKRQLETLIIRRLIGCVREDDTIARIQENVYGMILEDIKDTEKIPTIIEKIRFSVSAPVQIQDMSIKSQIALGWSIIPQDGFDPHEVLARTEIAMRSEKIQKSLHSKY